MEETAAPITRISNAVFRKDIDDALWATVKLHLYNLKQGEAGTKDYTNAINGLSKLLVDIKKMQPVSKQDKAALLKELEEYLNEED